MSIGERIRWDMPQPCARCGESDGYEVTPMPELRQRIKCNACKRVSTVDPELTELGRIEAEREYIARLVTKRS